MKKFSEYITESKKTYPFKVKIAGDISAEQESGLREIFDKYKVVDFKKASTTPVQKLPLDFPKLSNTQVNIYDVTVDYPVTPYELVNYIGNSLKIHEQRIVVRNPNEPLEQYQQEPVKREGALLNDSEYKELPKIDSRQFYGDEYNRNFIKSLNDELKANRKLRGEVIPSESDGKTTNDLPQGTASPFSKIKI